ncbi:Aste57867_12546 [Aphanomyces stellatus]|uniref:Purple acid phosphatase n=1 Tax=Aphanomyces stellatus TaxID=120398 RepID=A0A485KWH8_9STRA|nr:hypothetical protein As57867_012500 [Aphanomyces stellatus]VFT89397.1 Aste57867_12546 [Aphanomyces stellatus]
MQPATRSGASCIYPLCFLPSALALTDVMVKVITLFLASTAVVAAQSVSQVHLALTNRALDCAHGVSVNFASESAEPFTIDFAGGDQEASVTTTSSNYTVSNSGKTYESPNLHTANLCDLAPSTEYSYSINGGDAFSFVSPPGASEDPTVIGLVGDADLDAGAFDQLLTPVQGYTTQAIVIVGDYSYANGNHKIWDEWYNLQQPIFSKIPSIGINGNHEIIQSSKDWAQENYVGYINRAATPITEDNAAKLRTYYSVNIGLVHVALVDDYVGVTAGVGSDTWLAERELQLEWLQTDLAQVNRDETPYVVVLKHNPYYNTYQDHRCQCSQDIFAIDDPEACWSGNYVQATAKSEPQCGLQAKLEDVYAQFKVDVVFSGHVHGYERSDYVYKNQIDRENGSVYITTGAGGRGHAGARIENVPEWNLFAEPAKFGATRLIATREKMQVLWYTNDNLDEPTDSVDVYMRE